MKNPTNNRRDKGKGNNQTRGRGPGRAGSRRQPGLLDIMTEGWRQSQIKELLASPTARVIVIATAAAVLYHLMSRLAS